MIRTIETTKTSPVQQSHSLGILIGLTVVMLLSIAAWGITRQVYALELPFGIPGKALEYPLWAVLAGLAGNIAIHLTGTRRMVKPGIRTELFLKTGLVLLGASINLRLILTSVGGAILQTLILVSAVFFFSWWVAGKFGLDDKLRAVMATALAVCGVSAAIAAAGSVSARKEQVTYVTGLVILFALPMMILTPILARAMGLSDVIAGAWFGGNIDTTAAVIGAGTIYGETAQKMASIIKSTQNTLIGLVAFFLAIYFAGKQPGGSTRPSLRMIWDRFPKFVIGFILASLLFTLGWIDGGKGTAVDALKNWAFIFAFVAMGLEFSVTDFRQMGWKPVIVFLIATVFNTVLALLAAWVIFTFIFPVSI
jgi:uncharacterized membrane protein YadS